MLNEHTLDQLRSLRLDGMVHAIEEQALSMAAAELPFDDRLTLLVQREIAWRDDKRVARLLKAAKLKVASACVEDINWRANRSLDRALIGALAGGDWLRHARNVLISGATGSGKTWLACALAHQAARMGFSVLYVRSARLFDELQVAHGDGSFARRLTQLAKLDLLVIDDFAISPMGPPERNDLLELLDDRIGSRSTLITSQLPVKAWHTYLNDPTLADAILDRIVHSSHKIDLKTSKSMRDTEGAAQPSPPHATGKQDRT
jgi:DNA replication protein DnaC